eukprot:323955_1
MTKYPQFPYIVPIFSENTDWNLAEAQNKLQYAINEIGLCYYKINEVDKELYYNINPEIMSFFQRTINNASFVSELPNLREYQKKFVNYGYVDRQSAFDQVRGFVIPFENFDNDKLFINHNKNPFKGNMKIARYAENLSKHCHTFFGQILRCYFIENGLNKLVSNINDEVLKLMGNNPCKHLRFNYYHPLVAKRNESILNGVHSHCDYGFLAFLKPSAPGLQVKYNEKWYNVPYFEDRFVVNFGKALQITTNYGMKAAVHKVSTITNNPRSSIVFFYDPDINNNLSQYQTNGKLKILKDFKRYFYGDMFATHGKINKNAYKTSKIKKKKK